MTTTQQEFVRLSRPRPGVALVTLNRPERMNAMAFDVMIPLKEALEELGHDNDVRVVVLTGAGRGFCSGADQQDSGLLPHVDGLTPIASRCGRCGSSTTSCSRAGDAPARHRRRQRCRDRRRAVPGARHRCADRLEEAYFRAAGINNGLTASELGLSYLLPRAVGSSRAAEIMFTGRDVDAAEADRIGLVSRVVPGEDARGVLRDGRADHRCRRAGIELTKRSLWASLDAASLAQHMQHEGIGQLYVRMLTDNFEEATRARKEKRTPVFRDMR